MDLRILPFELASLSPVSVVVALTTVLLSIVFYVVQKRGLPPGPTGVPYFGYWPFLGSRTAHLQLDEMKKKYGDIFSFTFMGRLFINLGTIKAVREAHITKGDCFGNRPTCFSLFNYMFEDGVTFARGEHWKAQRKFFLQVMKERGVKALTDSLSGSLYDLIQQTVDELKALNGRPTNIIPTLTDKAITTLRLTLFGEGVAEKEIEQLIREYEVMVACMTTMNTLYVGKVAQYFILPLKSDYRQGVKSFKKMKKLLYEIIDQHKSTFNEDNIRDVIDEYIKERNDRRKKGDPSAEYFTDKSLMSSLLQFVGDGVLSVSFFSSIMIKSLVDFPDEQDKIHAELTDVVGSDRLPAIEDKPALPYTNAFLNEVIRMSDVFPLFASLECTKETTLGGYRIPVGAISMMNMWSCHYDPNTYENPRRFDPSRFIQKEGKKRPDLPILFGVGKRSCLGEGFAMTQIFLFMTAIVKNFHLSVPTTTKVDEERKLFETGTYNVIATPRGHK